VSAPSIRGATNPAFSDSGTATSPASTQVGDQVFVFVWSQSSGLPGTPPSHSILPGFTQVSSNTYSEGMGPTFTGGRLSVARMLAALAGAQPYTPYTVSGANPGETCAGIVVLQAPTFSDPVLVASSSSTNSSTPNPPNLGGLNGDVLVFAVAAWYVGSANATSAGAPTNYTMQAQGPSGTHLTHLAVATRELLGQSGGSTDPGSFSDNVSPGGTVTMTISVRNPRLATLNVTLGGASLGGQASVEVWATLGSNLDVVSLSATAAVSVEAALGSTLDGVTVEALAFHDRSADLDVTLYGVGLQAEALHNLEASLSVTLEGVGLSSLAYHVSLATADVTLGNLKLRARAQHVPPNFFGTGAATHRTMRIGMRMGF